MLRVGEDGRLAVAQNLTGEALTVVRTTELRASSLTDEAQAELAGDLIFDDVQTLEGYLESLAS